MIINKDCLEALKELKDNSVDSIVTDPPAGISFMGKEWDEDKGGRDNWIKWMSDVATECKRVLKHGGHAFVWAIPRTSHWTATAWENAGFEIRDVVAHVFGSGFPKSLNIGKQVDKLQGNEREVVGKQKGAGTTGDNQVGNQTFVAKNQYEDGTHDITKGTSEWEGWGTALKPAREDWILMRKPLSEKTVAENCLKWGTGGINIDISRVTPYDESAQQNNHENAKGGIVVSDKHEFYPSSLADAFSYSLQQLQDFFQHIASVRTSYSISYITPLSSAKVVFHNQGSQLLGVPCDCDDLVRRVYECASAELLPQGSLNGYPILSRLCGEYARPDVKGDREIFLLSTDVLSNIDRLNKELHTPSGHNNQFLVFVLVLFAYDLFNTLYHNYTTSKNKMQVGRFPANLIHNNSEEVRECFPETAPSKAGIRRNHNQGHEGWSGGTFRSGDLYSGHDDSGNASRFFKSIIYQAKASKSERNRGCEKLENKFITEQNKWTENDYRKGDGEKTTSPTKNNHPTVKPIALMEYLIKMVTPKGGIVLDPFAGSGSTLVAAKQNNFQYIGIEKEEEYCKIIEARLNSISNKLL